MRRREFLGVLGAVAAWPFTASAQPSTMPVIGILNNATLASQATRLHAFRQGLKQIGFVEGQNVAIEYGLAEGQTDRLPALAAELVRRQVTVLFANSTASALAAKAATATIPIVFQTGADPVELGLIASLNRPGGNVTGVAFLVNKLVPKRLELLRELAPGAATLGMLIDPTNPNAEGDVKDAQAAAAAFGRKLFVVRASSMGEIDSAFAALAQQGISALFVAAHTNFNIWSAQIVSAAARQAVAVSYAASEFVVAGGLTSYGPSQFDVYHQAGVYTGRILRGVKPADLPVMQPSKFAFVLNLKTAKALGLTISSGVLSIVDEVIE
jgi:putative ABC transport system substrate-binding protein